jgi:uncharacterized repeat protein (TIGR03803 family)
VVWKLAPNPDGTWGTLTVLHEFTGGADGAFPYAGLVFDAVGNLYGTTGSGGSTACMDGCGVVFKLAPRPEGTWTESVLYTFTGGADGDGPLAGLIFDAGDLYGTTVGGGASDEGVVFKLAPNSHGTWTESVLYSFTGGADGAHPYAGLVFDAAGNLYGTTYASGAYNNGVVFKLTPNPEGTWTESILHTFTGGADGATPYAGLIFDAAGNLYGTTDLGGGGTACTSGSGHMTGCGVVFKLAPKPDGSWTESVLHTFTGGADGANPYAGLIFHAAGNLYGTTTHGGFDNNGVVFELTPTSSG